eukprot:5130164-Pyramimonas_sp.AAC.2
MCKFDECKNLSVVSLWLLVCTRWGPVARPQLKKEDVPSNSVPSTLTRMVQLASSLATSNAVDWDGRSTSHFDMSQVGHSHADWVTPDAAGPHGVHDLHDSFDPGVPSMWEVVSGGDVGNSCGAVSGRALCFYKLGSRAVSTRPVNTIAGGVIRFSLFMQYEDGVQFTEASLEH